MAESVARAEAGGFRIANLDEARYECTFGRGCDGGCCRNGSPVVSDEEALTIAHVLPRIRNALRPEAQARIRRHGFLRSRGTDWPTVRVAGGWCVFFNRGCELHRLGLSEGQASRYKPASCAVFPLAQDRRGVWYIRQRDLEGETFDAVCLDPEASSVPAALSLQNEIALARKLDREGRYAERLAVSAEPAG